jgi:formate-dependent nitrite reductase membrane component NrfD
LTADGSITGVGTRMRSYYGRPIVKEPVWNPEIPWYFFTGGIAGASSLLHGFAELTGNRRLAASALYVGAACDLADPVLLIKDLGRPERFLNMLRMFKVTSPMSVGSWIVFVHGGAAVTSAALRLARRLPRVRAAADAAAFATGAPLATYTGALVANTSIPVWSEARDDLPWLFAASAGASAAAAATIFTPTAHAHPARRLALAAAAGELVLMERMQQRIGFVGEVYKRGAAGRYARIARAATAAGATVLAVAGARNRRAAAAGGALILAGGAALRWSIFRAGFQSARDPRYTVVPQRERLARA